MRSEYGEYVDWVNYQLYASRWCPLPNNLGLYSNAGCANAVMQLAEIVGGPQKLLAGGNSAHAKKDLEGGKLNNGIWGLSPSDYFDTIKRYKILLRNQREELEAEANATSAARNHEASQVVAKKASLSQIRGVAMWSLELSQRV